MSITRSISVTINITTDPLQPIKSTDYIIESAGLLFLFGKTVRVHLNSAQGYTVAMAI